MKKLLFFSVLIFSLLVFSQSASATESVVSRDAVRTAIAEFGLTLNSTTKAPPEGVANFNFDSIEEFQSFLRENKSALNLPTNGTTYEETDLGQAFESPSPYLDNFDGPATAAKYMRISWWSPYNGPVLGVFSKKNIDFKYHYTKTSTGGGRLTQISNINSFQTGYHDIKWVHRDSNSYLRGNTAFNVTVYGTYVLGATIKGNYFGINWNGQWSRYVDLGSKLNGFGGNKY